MLYTYCDFQLDIGEDGWAQQRRGDRFQMMCVVLARMR